MSTPPPPPLDDNADWKDYEAAFAAGQIGYDSLKNALREPKEDEYIDDNGRIDLMFNKIRMLKRRKRPLTKLTTLADIQQELGKLYSDMHHNRVGEKEFTKRAYMLSLMAQITKMLDKAPASGAALTTAT